MNIALWRKPEPMPMTLADEVFALIGSYDASDALIAREVVSDAARIAEQKIEEALNGIELDLSPSPKPDKPKKTRAGEAKAE